MCKCIQINIKTIHSSRKVEFDWPIMITYTPEKCKNTPSVFKRLRNYKQILYTLLKKKVSLIENF